MILDNMRPWQRHKSQSCEFPHVDLHRRKKINPYKPLHFQANFLGQKKNLTSLNVVAVCSTEKETVDFFLDVTTRSQQNEQPLASPQRNLVPLKCEITGAHNYLVKHAWHVSQGNYKVRHQSHCEYTLQTLIKNGNKGRKRKNNLKLPITGTGVKQPQERNIILVCETVIIIITKPKSLKLET